MVLDWDYYPPREVIIEVPANIEKGIQRVTKGETYGGIV